MIALKPLAGAALDASPIVAVERLYSQSLPPGPRVTLSEWRL
jgi:hypothetical protein